MKLCQCCGFAWDEETEPHCMWCLADRQAKEIKQLKIDKAKLERAITMAFDSRNRQKIARVILETALTATKEMSDYAIDKSKKALKGQSEWNGR